MPAMFSRSFHRFLHVIHIFGLSLQSPIHFSRWVYVSLASILLLNIYFVLVLIHQFHLLYLLVTVFGILLWITCIWFNTFEWNTLLITLTSPIVDTIHTIDTTNPTASPTTIIISDSGQQQNTTPPHNPLLLLLVVLLTLSLHPTW